MVDNGRRPWSLNALSVDVEDYFHVSAFEGQISPSDWPTFESRVARNTDRILALLDRYQVSATFFFLGWIAEQQPALVRRVQAAGHEIATHGYAHRLVTGQTPDEFRRDVQRSLDVLQEVVGTRVLGYRAPSYSITPATAWALQVLRELGLHYDSSLYPIRHDLGGFPVAPRHPHRIADGLWEVPLTTWCLGRWTVPVAGGGYLRFYPYLFTRWAVRQVNDEGLPAVVYVHPWELDPHQPRIGVGSLRSRLRHYQNLGKTEQRLESLCRDFRFSTIHSLLDRWAAAQPGPEEAAALD
jgi:polysaccharide deacetylase family protein (PEP-CTERM system associated)